MQNIASLITLTIVNSNLKNAGPLFCSVFSLKDTDHEQVTSVHNHLIYLDIFLGNDRFFRKMNSSSICRIFFPIWAKILLIYFHFCKVAFGMLDGNAFYMTQTIKDALIESTIDGEELSMSKVNSIDDYWEVPFT